jgi:hypothetical protein
VNPWIVLASIGLLTLVAAGVVAASTVAQYREARRLRCPEAGTDAQVIGDAHHAALTAAFTRPRLRVARCSLWLERYACAEGCLSQVEAEAEPAHSRAS